MLIEAGRSALESLRGHSLRSFLTALGVIVGVASVVAVIGLFAGLDQMISQQFKGLGADVLVVRAETSIEEAMRGERNRISYDDYALVSERLPQNIELSPSFDVSGGGSSVQFGRLELSTRIVAATPEYMRSNSLQLDRGRFVLASDSETRRRVVVIGSKVRERLKVSDSDVGGYLQVNGEWMKIVGIMAERGDLFGLSQDDYVVVPFETAVSLLAQEVEPDLMISVRPPDEVDLAGVREQILSLLGKEPRSGDARSYVRVETASQLAGTFTNITRVGGLVAFCIVAVSLVVGGIGVMNIMLVSVTERTREIGIYKALGATPGRIKLQFLTESVVVASIGGIIGIAVGWAICGLISAAIPTFPPTVPPVWSAALAFSFSAVVGIVAGFVPAAKASRVDAISSLRHE